MQVVILAGGKGTRISEYTKKIPKPMVKIGGKPIIEHIINYFKFYGHNDFYIALGYKGEIIERYFKKKKKNYNIKFIKTGLNSMTGFRLNCVMNVLKREDFLLTYGDGLSNVDINKLILHHKRNNKHITVTAVRPPARFGFLKIKNSSVINFEEKNQINEGWINGGYFVMEPEVFEFLENDQTILEREPLEKIAKIGELVGFKHEGFWQCMDTKRDKDLLENLISRGITPWLNKI